MPESSASDKNRREGRAMACDGLLASEFGGRKTGAGSNAIRQLRRWDGRRRARNRFLALAATVAVLLAGSFYWIRQGQDSYLAVLDSPSPGGVIVRNNRIIQAIKGIQLMPGDIVRTPKGVATTVCFHGSKSVMTVAGQSELKLLTTAAESVLELRRGAIDMEFVPQTPGDSLLVRTEQAEARVTGTHFLIAAKQTSTWLQVLEGSVRFDRQDGDATITVGSHQYSVAARGLDLTAHADDERWQAPYSMKPTALALAL